MKKHNFIFLAFFLLTLNGCNATGNIIKENIPKEISIGPIILFCPEDNCEKNLIALINLSKNSIHCAFYDLKLENVTKMLALKSHNVDVKILMEKDNYKEQIKGPGIRLDNNKQLMHNKFCIIDNNIVWTGSFNPTIKDAYYNDNNVLIFYSRYLAENFEEEFNELWNNTDAMKIKYPVIYLNSKKIENFFCPEDCQLESSSSTNRGNALYKIIDLIGNANKSVQLASFTFTLDGLADELIRADIRGLNVTILIENQQRNVKNSQYQRLKDFEIDIKVDNNKYNMHNKFIIIDGKIVITGSPNFTLAGFNKNDENILIIYDEGIAKKYLQEFGRIFA